MELVHASTKDARGVRFGSIPPFDRNSAPELQRSTPQPVMVDSHDENLMQSAIDLAARGQGRVEPNPMVGCVIARRREGQGDEIVGQGWHDQFGGPHAEIVALERAGDTAAGATMYVTLEPCCHHGKTPPCAEAIIRAGIQRVVVAQVDPFDQVAGRGIDQLRQAGIQVDTGVLEDLAMRLNAPYLKRVSSGQPWVIAKWAMTLDGRIATRQHHSQWISNQDSRRVVHQLRGRMDAIIVGRNTVEQDDPLLTARPPGPRVPARVVLDSRAALPAGSQLVRSVREAPVLVVVSRRAKTANTQRLESLGCEVIVCEGEDEPERLASLLEQLARREMTNVLVEGGGHVLGRFWDAQAIDEVRVFVAPKLAGGAAAISPLEACGVAQLAQHPDLQDVVVEQIGADVYIRGVISKASRA